MIVGAHIEIGKHERPLDNYLQWLHPNASVGLGCLWEMIEKKPGVYTWPDWMLRNADLMSSHKVIYTVNTCPRFYRVDKDIENSPPKPEYYENCAYFIHDLIEHLHPYGVQIWNEPEMPPCEFFFGGFGKDGGVEYGKMLRDVYIRCKDHAVIFGGGLAMMSFSWQFLRDILSVGKYFDILSYHTYANRSDQFDLAITRSVKLRNIAKKPVALIETGYTGKSDEKQNEYIQHLLENAGIIKLIHNFTLANADWRNTDLVVDSVRRPAWYTWYNWLENQSP